MSYEEIKRNMPEEYEYASELLNLVYEPVISRATHLPLLFLFFIGNTDVCFICLINWRSRCEFAWCHVWEVHFFPLIFPTLIHVIVYVLKLVSLCISKVLVFRKLVVGNLHHWYGTLSIRNFILHLGYWNYESLYCASFLLSMRR